MGSRGKAFVWIVAGFVGGVAFVVACGSRSPQARVGIDGGTRDGGSRDSGLFDSGLFDSGVFDSGIDAGRDAAAQAIDCASWEIFEERLGNGSVTATGEFVGGFETIYSVPAGWLPFAYNSLASTLIFRRCAP